MRILASDGMEKNAVAALRAQGHEVVEQFYEPAELAEQVKNFDVLVVRSATKVRVPIIDAACETGKLSSSSAAASASTISTTNMPKKRVSRS